MGIFNRKRLVSLENSSDSNSYYHATRNKIVAQRDANLRNLKSGGSQSINRTEAALACLADPDVAIAYEKFKSILFGLNWFVESEDLKAKAFLQNQIDNNIDTLINALSLARITGIVALEKLFDKSLGTAYIKDLLAIDCNRIVYSIPENSTEYRLRFTTNKNPFDGEEFDAQSFLVFKHYSVFIENVYGMGIGSLLVELTTTKASLLELWHKMVYKYSEPIISINIPDNAADEEVDEFFDAIKNLKNSSRFVLPEGYNFKVDNVSSTGLADLIIPLIDRIDRTIYGLLTGEALTGKESSNGSNARDITAKDISNEKALSFAREMATAINKQLIQQLLAYNFPNSHATLKVSSPENLAETLDTYEKLKRLGVNFDAQWLADKFGIKLAEPVKFLGDNVS